MDSTTDKHSVQKTSEVKKEEHKEQKKEIGAKEDISKEKKEERKNEKEDEKSREAKKYTKEAPNGNEEGKKGEIRGKKREHEADAKDTPKKAKITEITDKKDAKATETKPEDKKEVEPKDSKAEKPKFVFGQSTSFGKFGGFGGFGTKKNPFANKEGEAKVAAKIFGSGSSFGNLFQNADKGTKPIFDKPFTGKATSLGKGGKKEDNSVKDNATGEDTVYRTIHLQKQDVKSGEEDETTLYQVKAKLYRMDLEKLSEGWKERGVGILKVNQLKKPTDSYRSRLIMRQAGNLKLILNLPIAKNIKVLKGMTSSFAGKKFIRIQTIEQGKPIQYALKIGQVENVPKVYDSIVSEIPK